MRYAKWSRSLVTGDPVVDEQHRALYALVNDLNASAVLGADKAMLEHSLDRIARYATTHFESEQRLMVQTAYPESGAHIAIHNEFRDNVTDLIAEFREGGNTSASQLAAIMETWLSEHITEHDRPLVAHVRAWRAAQ
jgi:hemerythrin-like metal-binding protein